MCVKKTLTLSGNWEYCIVVVWEAEAAAMRFRGFRGRGQASIVSWLYGTVPYHHHHQRRDYRDV